jgi:hypothetical protein
MIAQRQTWEVAAVASARLQRGDNVCDEVLKAFCVDGEAEDEAVGGALVDPTNEFFRDLLPGADEAFPRRGDGQRDLAQRLLLLLRGRFDAVGRGAKRVPADVAELGERRVDVVFAEIVMIEKTSEIGERLVN